jgi:cell volume regulation protein A
VEQIDANTLGLLFAAVLVVAGVLSSLIATRFGAPLLFLFLLLGMLVGEDGPGGIKFDDFSTANLVGTAALAIILFDGGLRTKARAFRSVLAPAGLLATAGVLITALGVALAAMLLLGLSFAHAFLLGAIVASTDAAAVFFLMRSGGLRLRRRVNDTLEVESATNDPLAVFLVIALVTVLKPGGELGQSLWIIFIEQAFIGAAVGIAGGLLLSLALNRFTLPQGLTPIFVAGGALAIYSATYLMHGSGFLAVYLAGLVVANRPTRAVAGVTTFTDAATWLAQIVMFVLLGLLATPHRLLDVLWPALGIALVLIFIARPIAVVACLLPFRFSWLDKAFVSWVGLRGAVAIFLATIPVLAEMPNGLLFFDVAFFVVLVSLVLQGWTVRPVAKLLGVALPGADHPESRMELDLPGQMEQELVGYPVRPDSVYLRHPRLPVWAKLVMVVRGEAILMPDQVGEVAVGDYVYLLAPPRRVQGLDRLFSETDVERSENEVYFGEFVVPGATPLSEIALLYATDADPPHDMTAADAFIAAFGTPVVGDTIPLGAIELVARTVEDERVVEVGLRLQPEPPADKLKRLARRFRVRLPSLKRKAAMVDAPRPPP